MFRNGTDGFGPVAQVNNGLPVGMRAVVGRQRILLFFWGRLGKTYPEIHPLENDSG